MQFVFDEKIEKFLKIILKNAQMQKIRVFFVGGIVRDYFLGKKTNDIDLLVVGNAIDFAKSFDGEIKIKSIHEDFATVKLIYNNLEIDVASTRKEKYPFSGCLPVVEKIATDLETDFKRRDFTINSLYCELKLQNNEIIYELIDLAGGLSDIKKKQLRVLHDKSYIDDPSRIIRGLGFKYRFGFDFSSCDKKLIEDYLLNINYEKMSHDRLLSVFYKVFLNNSNMEIFKEIIQKKYYKIIQKNELNPDFKRILTIIQEFELKGSNLASFYINILENKPVDKITEDNFSVFCKKIAKIEVQNLAYYYYKTNDDMALRFLSVKDIKLNIKGSDLIDAGYCEGKGIGKILDDLFAQKLENPQKYSSKQDELNWVLANYPKM